MTTKSTKSTPTKAPTPPARSRTRSKARATGRSSTVRYTDEQRAALVEQVRAEGMAATHKATGIAKSTLGRWCKVAGVDLGEEAKARTAKAAEALKAKGAVARVSTAERLEQLIASAGSYLATTTSANDDAAALIAALDPERISLEVGLSGPYAVVEDAAAQAAQRRAMALASLPLETRDAVGILTRAIHDLQLLTGQATERGDLLVQFGVPRPDALRADAGVVDEAQLAITGGGA